MFDFDAWFSTLLGAGTLEYLVRIVLACLCGALIGMERSVRQKDAGIRTHIILCMGAALVIIVSKYGFFDLANLGNGMSEFFKTDTSRIASNVITGISFLGAGVIYVRGVSIKGLTTAAGIWTCAGIGLAIGAGMYVVGIASSLLMVVIQILLHKFLPRFESVLSGEIKMTLSEGTEAVTKIEEMFHKRGISMIEVRLDKKSEGTWRLATSVKLPRSLALRDIAEMLGNEPYILDFTFSN